MFSLYKWYLDIHGMKKIFKVGSFVSCCVWVQPMLEAPPQLRLVAEIVCEHLHCCNHSPEMFHCEYLLQGNRSNEGKVFLNEPPGKSYLQCGCALMWRISLAQKRSSRSFLDPLRSGQGPFCLSSCSLYSKTIRFSRTKNMSYSLLSLQSLVHYRCSGSVSQCFRLYKITLF